MKYKLLSLILAGLFAACALAGCSSNQEEDTRSTTTSTTSSMLEGDALVTPAESEEVVSSETVTNEDGSITTTETMADGSVVTTTTASDGSVTQTERDTDGTVIQTQTAVDGTVTTTQTASDGTQTVTTTPPSTTVQQPAAPSSGGSTTTPPSTGTTTTPPATSTPSTPSTSTPATTPSTPSQATPDPEPTPEPTPEPDPEPVRERTIDPQYICDQVNARMGEVGMIDAVTEGMNAGLTYQESLDEIHTYMGWWTATQSLYVKSNDQLIQELLEALKTDYNSGHPSAWVEIDCYVKDVTWEEVSNIDDADYVRFIIYR